jgi:pimeloyl-ACP methyl ester carboxylesterase
LSAEAGVYTCPQTEMNEQSPLLLIPGLLCDGALWRNQVTGLRDCVDTIIADATRGESIREIAESVLCNAPERFCLAGFSHGSQIALQIAQIARERVRRLALLSATSRGLLPNVKIAIDSAISTIQEGHFEEYLEHSYVQYVHPSRVEDTGLKCAYVEMARRVGPKAGVRQMRALLSVPGTFNGLDQIRGIKKARPCYRAGLDGFWGRDAELALAVKCRRTRRNRLPAPRSPSPCRTVSGYRSR